MQKLLSLAILGILAFVSPAVAQRSTPIQLLRADSATGDEFGSAVAVDGDTMIVAVPEDDVGTNGQQGSAQIYRWTGANWTLEATLTATDGASDDRFGSSVAISGDTAIVGAHLDNVGSMSNQGSAYVFVRSGTTWTQQAQLTATAGLTDDFFGISVAISGDTAIVGGTGRNRAGPRWGSACVFTRSGTTWTQQAELNAATGAAGDSFGRSVALFGDTALVGAPGVNVGTNIGQGSAYVFVRSGSTWTQQAQLLAADGEQEDVFGISVALSGDTALVGARRDNVGAVFDQGSAYVFTRSGTTWSQQAQLIAADATIRNFGISVALSGDTALVGAYREENAQPRDEGSAYVFKRTGAAWAQQAKLTATDRLERDQFGYSVAISGDTAIVGANADDLGNFGNFANTGSTWIFSRVGSTWIGPDFQALAINGASNDRFGTSVALSGDTALVGAHVNDFAATIDQGSAYVFTRTGTTWPQQTRLLAADGAAGDFFGWSVALSGDTAIVGAYADDVGANTDQGSAYIFIRSGGTWVQQAQLTAIGGAAGDNFGISVAISGDTALVGASGDNGNQGSVFVFTRSGSTWTQRAQLTATGGALGDQFGISVSLSGDTALVGANLDDVGANIDQGSAYLFTWSGSAWIQQAQLNGAGGAAGDNFGGAVALAPDMALIGAYRDDVEASGDQGSAYVFTRSGTNWTQQAQLTGAGGEADDNFGRSVALSVDMALVGANLDNVGVNIDQGSVYIFTRSGTIWTQQGYLTGEGGAGNDSFGRSVAISGDVALVGVDGDTVGGFVGRGSAWTFHLNNLPPEDMPLATNDTTQLAYAGPAAAIVPAVSGQQISVTEAAWRSATTIDTTGRSLSLLGTGDVRTPLSCAITLGGSTTLSTPADHFMDVFGTLSVAVSEQATVSSGSFRLGSRGILTARANSSLTINAPIADLDGQTRLEQGASIIFAGPVEAIGPVTADLNASLTSGGVFTNIDTLAITSGTITTPRFDNRARVNVFGNCAVLGAFTSEGGGTITIRSGTLLVSGSLTNSGSILGSVCPNCLAPNLEVGGDLNLGSAANLTMPSGGSLVKVGGSFNAAINSNVRYHMRLATLQLEGTGSEQTLEVMSTDIGLDVAGLDRTRAGRYPIGTLRIGPSPSIVRLVDVHDNNGLGQTACEAIYVDTLIIDAGSRLVNTSCRIYYNTLVNNGTVDVPGNLVSLVPPIACDYDFNQDENVDLLDAQQMAQVFVGLITPEATWLNGDLNGDENADLTDAQLLAAYVVTGNCGL